MTDKQWEEAIAETKRVSERVAAEEQARDIIGVRFANEAYEPSAFPELRERIIEALVKAENKGRYQAYRAIARALAEDGELYWAGVLNEVADEIETF